MDQDKLPYDKFSVDSIMVYAERLEGHTLREMTDVAELQSPNRRRGAFAITTLQHPKLAMFNCELHILHIFVMFFQFFTNIAQLPMRFTSVSRCEPQVVKIDDHIRLMSEQLRDKDLLTISLTYTIPEQDMSCTLMMILTPDSVEPVIKRLSFI